MPKVKIKRTVPTIDMTAMVDVAFLLLTFFILTTKFKAEEKVVVDTPSSTSETVIPEINIMIITVNKEGAAHIGFGDQDTRSKVLEKIIKDYSLTISDEGKNFFKLQSSVGMPFKEMQTWLNLSKEEMKEYKQKGIPYPHNTEEGQE